MRKPRLHVPSAFYHVTLRGNHRQDIVFSPDDRSQLNTIVSEVISRYGARLHAYCWMTNHTHMLIQVGDIPLGRVMLRIASRYAHAVQARFHTTGHLFERRYHAVLVDVDAYLLELLRYIHLNPVRAKMVNSPDDYVWSSHLVYLGLREESWVTTDFSLSMFHNDLVHARTAYQQFVHARLDATSPLVECNPNDRRILGDDTFAARLLGEAWRPRSTKTIEDLIKSACEQFHLSNDQLLSISRQRKLAHARAWITHQAIVLRICSLSHVARLFGCSEAALRQTVKRHFNYP
jgi:putative transposase